MKSLAQFLKDNEISDSQKKLQDIMKGYEFPQPEGPENNLTKGNTYSFPEAIKQKPSPYAAKGEKAGEKSKPFGDMGTPKMDFDLKYGKLKKSAEVSSLETKFKALKSKLPLGDKKSK